ncbi:hypothetical protein BABINDRAFT_147887 [Babjeviella inositovora NRRL Y-12698]|uniref:Uncharacterized protein n=1 Tax=Babjeviella inositovora NRRL Y-12698 TaxID=984486 RepID=A0A1E3QN17_9ASCO|nr:uncharacterized protein BABINDRAFT_147887 [Babjeviella inositovora NRRL Y-12698]ODQ79085.1 hypothetical protein BABINDRAFT_147887 [Babjeviella inositovora NRRL Y-12698]
MVACYNCDDLNSCFKRHFLGRVQAYYAASLVCTRLLQLKSEHYWINYTSRIHAR